MPTAGSNSNTSASRSPWRFVRPICEATCILFLAALLVLTLSYFVQLRPFWVSAAHQPAASAPAPTSAGQAASASASVVPGSSAPASASATCSVAPQSPKGKTAAGACQTCCAAPCCSAAPATDISPAVKLQIQAQIEVAQGKLEKKLSDSDADKKAVLNQLITLVGGYSVILGLTAFITLRETRKDAREQLDEELAQNKEKLDEFDKNLSDKLDAFDARLSNELPELQNLGERLRELFLYLNRLIPPESDWTLEATYGQISERDRQQILISEATVGALQLFVSSQTAETRQTLAGLYRRLARFYFARYQAEKAPGDAERAEIYVAKSLDFERGSAGYVLRGVFALGIVDVIGTGDPVRRRQLLELAQADLAAALRANPNEIAASYNLAIADFQLDRLDDAVRVSIDGIQAMTTATPDKVPNQTIRKYGGAIYSNLACYLARKATQTGGSEADGLRRQCVDQIKAGATFLNKAVYSPAYSDLKKFVEKELLPAGDLNSLDSGSKDQILAALGAPEV